MPSVIQQTWTLLYEMVVLPQVLRIKYSWKIEMSDELSKNDIALKIAILTSGIWLFSPVNGKLVELFIGTAGENDHKLLSNIANLTALTRQSLSDVKTRYPRWTNHNPENKKSTAEELKAKEGSTRSSIKCAEQIIPFIQVGKLSWRGQSWCFETWIRNILLMCKDGWDPSRKKNNIY